MRAIRLPVDAIAAGSRMGAILSGAIVLPALVRMLLAIRDPAASWVPAWGAQLILLGFAVVGARALASHLPAPPRLPWSRWSRDAIRVGLLGALLTAIVTRVRAPIIDVGALVPTVAGLLVGPIIEEILFRGILPALLIAASRDATGTTAPSAVVVLSSAAFAFAHGRGADVGELVASFSLGMAFHAFRGPGESLAFPMVAHAGVNVVILGAMTG